MITLELVRAHDYETLEKLRKQMLGYVRKIVKNHDTAEDVVQEAMIKVLNNVDKFDGTRCHVATWAMRIARNTAYTAYSASKKHKHCQLDIDVEEEKQEPLHYRLEEFRKAVDALPEDQRIVADLIVAGKSSKEISKALGISVNYAYKKTFDVRQSLKAMLC